VEYGPLSGLRPVAVLAWGPLVLAAHPSFAASTPEQLIKLAQDEPVNFSTPGIGSSHHLAGEYINALRHTKLVHVPYRGSAPAVTDAVSAHVGLTISCRPPIVPFLQSHMLKSTAV